MLHEVPCQASSNIRHLDDHLTPDTLPSGRLLTMLVPSVDIPYSVVDAQNNILRAGVDPDSSLDERAQTLAQNQDQIKRLLSGTTTIGRLEGVEGLPVTVVARHQKRWTGFRFIFPQTSEAWVVNESRRGYYRMRLAAFKGASVFAHGPKVRTFGNHPFDIWQFELRFRPEVLAQGKVNRPSDLPLYRVRDIDRDLSKVVGSSPQLDIDTISLALTRMTGTINRALQAKTPPLRLVHPIERVIERTKPVLIPPAA